MGTYVRWKTHYSVGDPTIDAQHQQILSIINDLHHVMNSGKERNAIDAVLDRLLQYTITHFQHEEQVMRACGYPDLDNHKSLHDKMQRRTTGLRANSQLLTASDTMRLLKEWWINHICGEDQCYMPYVSAMRQGKSLPGIPTQPVGNTDWYGQALIE